jgi:hypothetical protein
MMSAQRISSGADSANLDFFDDCNGSAAPCRRAKLPLPRISSSWTSLDFVEATGSKAIVKTSANRAIDREKRDRV